MHSWVVMLVAAVGGVALAFAEHSGFTHSRTVLALLGCIGLLYLLFETCVSPYMKLKVLDSGFCLVDHLNQDHRVRWSEVVQITVERTDGELEWFIKTSSGELVCIMENEIFYRGRLRRGAAQNLVGFNDDALRQAVDSASDGSWECFRTAPHPAVESAHPGKPDAAPSLKRHP